MSRTIVLQLRERDTDPADEDELGPAAEHAIERAREKDGIVHAISVVDTGRYGEPALSSSEVYLDERADEHRRRLAAFAARATVRGVDVETRCSYGRPNDDLVEYARDVNADLVVLDRRLPHAARERLHGEGVEVERPDRTARASRT